MKRTDILNSLGLLVARLGFGGYMLTHGLDKLEMLLNGQGEHFVDPMGIGPTATLALVTFAEFGCAILVILGLLTRLAAVPLITTMAVATFWAHAADPWTAGEAYRLFEEGATDFPVSKQPAMMFLIGFLALLLTGPGKLSLDALLWPALSARRERRAAAE